MVDLETFVSSESNLLDCVRFHFMSILRKELTGISVEWNPHLLSPSRNNTSSGKPNFMYFPPHLYGTTDRMISTNSPKTDKFVTAKFCFCEMQNIFNEKEDRKDFE